MKKWGIVLSGLALALLLGPNPAPAQEINGEELIGRLGCRACHALKGQGGAKGPDWDGVGARLTPEQLKQQILFPQKRMPSYAHLQPEELKAVVEYLKGLR